MESLSEDEFAWTSASSVTNGSDSEVTMAHEEESESGKSFKKKLKKELLLNGHHNEHDESTDEKRRHKKKFKREKESQSPSSAARHNGHDATLDAEHLLKTKVKEERAGFHVSRERSRSSAGSEREPSRERRRRRETERGTAADRVDDEPRKNKRKRKSSKLKNSFDATPDPIIDKFEAEETVVETRGRISERITFEDESELQPSASPPASNVVSRAASPAVVSPPSSPAASSAASRAASPAASSAASRAASPAASSAASRAASPAASSAASRAASPPDRLGRFLRSHAHLQPVIGALERGAAVGPDDDVWLLRCPRDLSAAALLGATLRPDARRKLTLDGRAYEAAPAPCGARVALLARAAGFTVRAVPLRGALRLRERVPRVRAPAAAPEPEPERIPLPATRPRHPLLGAARLPRDVRRRLRAASARADSLDEPDAERRRDGKMKKKRGIAEPESGPEPERAPRKRKRSTRNENETEERSESEKPERAKRDKREKRRRDEAALWDSERAIAESLFGR